MWAEHVNEIWKYIILILIDNYRLITLMGLQGVHPHPPSGGRQ